MMALTVPWAAASRFSMSTYSAALPVLRRALVFGPELAELLDPVSLLMSPNIGQRLFRLSSLSLQQKPEQYAAIMHSLRLRRKFCGDTGTCRGLGERRLRRDSNVHPGFELGKRMHSFRGSSCLRSIRFDSFQKTNKGCFGGVSGTKLDVFGIRICFRKNLRRLDRPFEVG